MSQKQDSASTPQNRHQQPPHRHRSSFLPERLPPTNPSQHYHDAFGDGDAGVDYGDPLDLEEGDYDSIDGSCGDGLGHDDDDAKADHEHDEVDGEARPLATAAAMSTPVEASLDELYEEVGLHETTLATLYSKLTALTEQIEAEKRVAALLRQDIQRLTHKKLILKKRTEGGVDLVKRVEATLEKCLDRLRGVLKRNDLATNQHDDARTGDEQKEDDSGLFVGGNRALEDWHHDENTQFDSNNAFDTNTLQDEFRNHTVSQLYQPGSQQTSNAAVNNKTHDDRNASPCQNNTSPKIFFTEITLHFEERDTIQWPSTESTDESQRRVNNAFSTWRTNLPSPSLWHNVDSTDLLTQLMNISSLENLWERRHLVEKSLLPAHCGWVKESCILGTTLDVYRHVDCKRWFNGSRQTISDAQVASQSIDSNECALDPNAILCPYELGGTCADDRCLYQHLGRRPVQSVVTLPRSEKRFLRYYALPDLRMPPPLSQTDFMTDEWHVSDGVMAVDGLTRVGEFKSDDTVAEQEQHRINGMASYNQLDRANRVYPCPTCTKTSLNADDLQNHLKQCNPYVLELDGTAYNVHNVLLEESNASRSLGSLHSHNETIYDEQRSENMSATHETVTVDARDIIENRDFINLPTVDDSSDEDDSSNESLAQNHTKPSRKSFIFDGQLWWQEVMPRLEFEFYSPHIGTVDTILLSFGFQVVREHYHDDETATRSISTLRCTHPYFDANNSSELNETLLIARTVDFCRICIHMGQDTLGLAVLRGVSKFNLNGLNRCLLECAEDSRKVISTRRGACDVFTCQMHLLLISEFYRVCYAWLREDKSSLTEPSLEELLNVLNGHAEYTSPGPDLMMHHISSRLPSKASTDGAAQSSWEPFVFVLQLQLEKNIVVPFSHKMTKKQQFSFLLECVHIGRSLQVLVESVRDQTFSPLSHALDPVWSVMQRLLQKSAAQQNLHGGNLLMPHVILILVIGPVIFACVSNIVSYPVMQTMTTEGEGYLPQFDSRRRLDLSALDVFIVEMIKVLRRYARNTQSFVTVEPLLSTLNVLSVAISVSLGEFDKVQLRLENALNSKNKSADREAPSINVLSEMLWSQLVHLRMNCPSYHESLEVHSSEMTEDPCKLLHPGIADTHNEIASRIMRNGVILRELDLCGDRRMMSASSCNRTHHGQWQSLVSLAMTKYSVNESVTMQSENPEDIEFHISHEIDKPDVYHIEFPLSLLITGQILKHLSIVGCMLDELPYSIGVHLTGLLSLNVSDNQLHEIPSSISFVKSLQILDVSRNKIEYLPESIKNCINLQVIDVSHNKLSTFPGDLALHLHQLQSFIVDGNPAHESLKRTEGRAQKRRRIKSAMNSKRKR